MPLPRPARRACSAANAARLGNIAPPGSSRWPVSTLSTSTSHARERAELLRAGADAAVHAPRAARARARARARGSRRPAIPQRAATRSGAKPRDRGLDRVDAGDVRREPAEPHQAPRRTACARCRAAGTRRRPGRMKWCCVGDVGGLGAPRIDRRRAGRRARASPSPCRGSRAPSTCCRSTPSGSRRARRAGRERSMSGTGDRAASGRTSARTRAASASGRASTPSSTFLVPSARREPRAVEQQAELVRGRVAERPSRPRRARARRGSPGQAAIDLGERLVPGHLDGTCRRA